MLAVLKAGGMYLPLDAGYPAERLQWMLEDIQPAVLITQTSVEPQLPSFSGKIIRLDSDRNKLSKKSKANPASEISGRNLAYVIYTSGSTGKPKGVGITHSNAATLMHWAREVYSAEELSGVLASTSICFDLSVYEIFVPLCWGAGDGRGLTSRDVAPDVLRVLDGAVAIVARNQNGIAESEEVVAFGFQRAPVPREVTVR